MRPVKVAMRRGEGDATDGAEEPMTPGREAARQAREAAGRSLTLAVARDAGRDVVGRWRDGLMGRWRWLALGPLTAVLAAAAIQDVASAEGALDRFGRLATAAAVTALHLNVAAKRLRDMRFGGWGAALALNGALALAALTGQLHGAVVAAYLLAMFLFPGDLARAAHRLTASGGSAPGASRGGRD